MLKEKKVLLFADRLPPLAGGMEMHGGYFIDYFRDHTTFPLLGVVSKDEEGNDIFLSEEKGSSASFHDVDPDIIFFNSGRWIEELVEIKRRYPHALFVYRTGGNEILKAPLIKNPIPRHSQRQAFWVQTLNDCIDVLVTNSAYTENRLRDLGLTCPFFRSVGGVNSEALKGGRGEVRDPLMIFSAARFVPYKNPLLLLKTLGKLVVRGVHLKAKLAGDGPLLSAAQSFVKENNLEEVITFLGVLNNQKTCYEIANADVYMQLSGDVVTHVPGGSYVHSEGMGRSILEALTAGTFVIAGRSGALPEIVSEGKGLLVDLSEEQEMVNVIARTLQNLPKRMKFDSIYCWSRIFKEYEELFSRESITCN